MFRPIFLPKVERQPRTEWGCQPVAFTRCFKVAPPDRFTSSSTWAVLLPWRTLSAFAVVAWRAPLTALFAEVAFLAQLALAGATRGVGVAPFGVFGGSRLPAGGGPAPARGPVFRGGDLLRDSSSVGV